MKHNDKTSQSDSSARLDALLSDFLNKDIVEPAESQPSAHATSMPLGDLFADDAAAAPKSPTDSRTPAATQKVVPVNRTEVWEATSKTGRLSETESSGLRTLAADQLEKNVNSILGASAAAASGKKPLFGSIAVILLLVAGLLIWQSRRTAVPQQLSEEPAVTLSPSEIDAPPSTQAPLGAASVPEAHPGTPEAAAANPSNNSSHDRRPAVAVLVPDSPASAGTASTVTGVSRSTASNAARLQQMPAPTLGHSNLTLGAIQDLPSFQPAPPPAPLPLPPGPPASAVKNAVPDSTRTTTATPAVPLTKVQPVYPELARKMNVAGTVHVAIVVDTAGKVISAKAVDGPPVLRGSAELAVKQWRFRPSTMNGKPVTGNGTVSVRFNLDRR